MNDWLEYLVLAAFIALIGLLTVSGTALMLSGQMDQREPPGPGEAVYVPLPHLMPGGYYSVY